MWLAAACSPATPPARKTPLICCSQLTSNPATSSKTTIVDVNLVVNREPIGIANKIPTTATRILKTKKTL